MAKGKAVDFLREDMNYVTTGVEQSNRLFELALKLDSSQREFARWVSENPEKRGEWPPNESHCEQVRNALEESREE